jgi:tryptophan synthase alpha chain
MADGPVIQRASERALTRGITLERVLQDVRNFRADNALTPVVLMGYANPIEQYGLDAFGAQARDAGVDGVLIVDYPPEEASDFARTMRACAIDPIFLLAPTSTEKRIAAAARLASGYLYYVALKGVTGAASLDTDSVAVRLPSIRQQLRRQLALPLAVGFGIRDAQTACKVAAVADAVVIGSRIVQLLEETASDQAAATLRNFMHEIRQALDACAT